MSTCTITEGKRHSVSIAAQTVVKGAAIAQSETEAFKKVCQIIKAVFDLIVAFTTVGVLRPMISAIKTVVLVLNATDFIGRIKEWVVPDKDGRILIQWQATKIVNRVLILFANLIDVIRLMQFVKVFDLLKLGKIATFLGKVSFFKTIFEHFPDLAVVKNVFVFLASQWSILDTSINIYHKKQETKRVEKKQQRWQNVRESSTAEQGRYFKFKAQKYEKVLEEYKGMSKGEFAIALKKLAPKKRKKINQAKVNEPKFRKLSQVLLDKATLSDEANKKLGNFLKHKVEKYDDRIKAIKASFTKSAVSIACEVSKMALTVFASILILFSLGSLVGPSVVVSLLALVCNGLGLFKFMFDKLYTGPRVRSVTIPELAAGAPAA